MIKKIWEHDNTIFLHDELSVPKFGKQKVNEIRIWHNGHVFEAEFFEALYYNDGNPCLRNHRVVGRHEIPVIVDKVQWAQNLLKSGKHRNIDHPKNREWEWE